MVCPNHGDTQICPDCTYQLRCHWCSERCVIIQHAAGHGQSEDCRCDRHARPDFRDDMAWMGPPRTFRVEQASFVPRRSLPPLEQHKADLEMIIAACVTGAGMTGEAACTAIAKLANGMLLRIDRHMVVDGKCSCVGDQS